MGRYVFQITKYFMRWIKRLIEEFLYRQEIRKKKKKAKQEDPYIYK